jgi:PhnB protein
LVTDDPDAVFARAVNAGATGTSTVSEEHGWRVGRVVDPYGHEWEIGRPIGDWPAAEAVATRRERKGGADEA